MSEERTLYEACYIMDVNTSEEQVAQIAAITEGAVTDAGGEVVGTRDFGSRRLAYEIDGHVAGVYKLLYFYGNKEAIESLKHEMAVNQTVVRARVFAANPDALVRGDEPEAETAEPEAETAEPEAETAEPEAETAEPEAETAEPEADEQ